MNLGKSKQMQAYDAEYAGKQLAAQGRCGQSRNNGGQGNLGAGRGDSGQNQPRQEQQMVVHRGKAVARRATDMMMVTRLWHEPGTKPMIMHLQPD